MTLAIAAPFLLEACEIALDSIVAEGMEGTFAEAVDALQHAIELVHEPIAASIGKPGQSEEVIKRLFDKSEVRVTNHILLK